jgi:cellulose 1,4-beta-cellobiosidase
MRRAALATVWVLACASCAEGEDLGAFYQPGGPSSGAAGATSGTSVGSTVGSATSSSGAAGSTSQTVGSGGSSGGGDASTSAGGSGGFAGTAGFSGGGGGATGGTGGSGGAVSDAAVDRFVPVTKGLILLYKANNTGSKADAIASQVTVRNMGTDTVPLAELTIRYYLVDEIAAGPEAKVQFAHVSGSGPYREIGSMMTIQAKPLPNPVYGKADTYVELGFMSGAGSTTPGDEVLVDWKYNAMNFAMVTQTNDYSFDGTKTTPTQWDHITILRGGNVIWGTPPQ